MDVRIAQERAFVLTSTISADQAREKAWGQKISVFGGLSSLMFRQRDDEIQVTGPELRYEPFWHVTAHSELEYEIRETFETQSRNPAAIAVTLELNPAQPIELGGGRLTLAGVTRCRESQRREQLLDGLTGEERPQFAAHLRLPMTELQSLEGFGPAGAVVLAPEYRSSFVVRQQMGALMKAVHADRMFTELVEVSSVALFFRPLYAFDYAWPAKQRQQSIEIDGATGEVRNTTRKVGQLKGSRLDKDLLFDITADAVGMVVPGGNIALKVGRMVVQRTKS